MSSTYTGIPTAAQSPGIAPALGGYPEVVLPADGDALSAASVAQMTKALADFSAFSQLKVNLHNLALFGSYYLLDEDFDSSALNTRFALTGTGSLVDDSAAGAYGAYKLNPAAGLSSNIKTATKFAAIAGDFSIEVMVRLPNAIASGDSGFILLTDTGSGHFLSLGYAHGTVSSHWYAQVESNPVQDLGVLPSSTYQKLTITRFGSTLAFSVNGTVGYTTTYSSTVVSGKLEIFIQDGGAATAVMDIDYVKMFTQR